MTFQEWQQLGLFTGYGSWLQDYNQGVYNCFKVGPDNTVQGVWGAGNGSQCDELGSFDTLEAAQLAVVTLTLANPV